MTILGGYMVFEEVKLSTNLLNEQKHFYAQTLGLNVVQEEESSFTVAVGETKLTFIQTAEKDDKPFYHFAFNIAENKFQQAKEFLADRITLLQNGANDEFEFLDWNAHAIYFYDPSGNIVEYIARHNINSNSIGEFTINDLLNVSEVGLPVEDVSKITSTLKSEVGLPLWQGNGTTFQPVGDEQGLFIIVPTERGWFPTNDKAKVFPVIVKIRGNHKQYTIPHLPYQIFY